MDAPSWPSGAPLPADYPFTVTCDSAGVTDIPLVGVDGSSKSNVTVPADDTVHYNGGASPATDWSHVSVPWGATCQVAETPVPTGAEVTYDPASATVDAYLDLTAHPAITNPAPSPSPASARVTATNSYSNAGFTVTKTVDSDAVDQDGDPIVYGPFDFTASCLFLGAEVLDPADQTFSVASGASRAVTDLPTGSDCTVTETGTDGAADSTVEVTQGATTTPGVGATATFTVVQGDETATSVDFTNAYDVGSLRVAKTIDGSGAGEWGDADFTVAPHLHPRR